jgi:hypothetical protein
MPSSCVNSVLRYVFAYERLHEVSVNVQSTRLIVQYVLVEAHHALLQLFLRSRFNTLRPNAKSLTGRYSRLWQRDKVDSGQGVRLTLAYIGLPNAHGTCVGVDSGADMS